MLSSCSIAYFGQVFEWDDECDIFIPSYGEAVLSLELCSASTVNHFRAVMDGQLHCEQVFR